MLNAIYIGLSGMDAYSTGLQVISNNVANLNTPGFKAKTVQFSDLFDNAGSGGLTFLGSSFLGTTGNGVQVDGSRTDFKEGTLQQTGNPLDLAIQGTGFLVLLNNGQTYYARTGSFAVDNDGYISQQGSGYHLGVLDSTGKAVPLNVDDKRTSAPAATTRIAFSQNLSSSGTEATVSSIDVYDDRGGKQVWTVKFEKSTAAGAGLDQWDASITDANGNAIGSGTLKFNGSVPDPTADTMTVTNSPAGAGALSVVLDFSGVTSFSSGTTSTIQTSAADGNAEGDLSTVTIDDTGQVLLTYSNKKTVQEGAVAIADFRNPQGLTQLSNGLFQPTGAGEFRVLPSGANGVGTLVSQQIEASNVDLSKEFGDLILVQRGFQACSQVLSISNDMIQQLFGIRGQG
ncbi:MAG: flagellar basal-body rod protein FlgF [Rhizomicrobium sp.]